MQTQRHIIIGLDISKEKIDCCIERNGTQQHLIISNDNNGYQYLFEWLGKDDYRHAHACCEATNTYWQGIARYCYINGIKISVVNPSSIKAYGKLRLKRIKTDKQDAKLIADYCKQYQPQSWQPDSKQKTILKSLYRRTCQLNQILVAEKTRLQTADRYGKPSINRTIEHINREIIECREQMQNLIDKDNILKHQQIILQTIPGIGKHTAQILLAVTAELHKYPTAKHLISWLGLSPIVRQSGKCQGFAKVSKMGDKSLRKALYMPARAACLNSKLWRGWFDYHVNRGKHPKQVYIMMMCKLIRYAYACLTTNNPFDASIHTKRIESLKIA